MRTSAFVLAFLLARADFSPVRADEIKGQSGGTTTRASSPSSGSPGAGEEQAGREYPESVSETDGDPPKGKDWEEFKASSRQRNGDTKASPAETMKKFKDWLLRTKGRAYSGDQAPAPDGNIEAMNPEASADRKKTLSASGVNAIDNALRMGDALKWTPDAGGVPPGASAVPGEGSPQGQSAHDPAAPESKQDLIAASVSGFRNSFKATGMSVASGPDGKPQILGPKGAPASPEELAGLSQHIRSQPKALMSRPDFFEEISPDRYNELKADFRNPGNTDADVQAAAFKDITTSPAMRDFLRSRSCGKLDGNCNEFARELPYKKGNYVPPEDLDDIWKFIRSASPGGGKGFQSAGYAKYLEKRAARKAGAKEIEAKLSGSAFSIKSISGKFKKLYSRLGNLMGGGAAAPSSDPSYSSPDSGQGGEIDWGSRGTAELSGNARALRPDGSPPEAPKTAAGPSPSLNTATFMPLGLYLLLLGIWSARRRRSALEETR